MPSKPGILNPRFKSAAFLPHQVRSRPEQTQQRKMVSSLNANYWFKECMVSSNTAGDN